MIRHHWDGQQLLAELDATEANRRSEYAYYPGTDQPLAMLTGATTVTTVRYVQQDLSGNVIGLQTGSNTVSAYSLALRPWGEYAEWSAPVLDTLRLRWKGLLYEGDSTKLMYVRARWYDPVIHRFISQDPIGLAGGINPYVFANNDPVNGSDPSGLDMCMWGKHGCPGNRGPTGGAVDVPLSPGDAWREWTYENLIAPALSSLLVVSQGVAIMVGLPFQLPSRTCPKTFSLYSKSVTFSGTDESWDFESHQQVWHRKRLGWKVEYVGDYLSALSGMRTVPATAWVECENGIGWATTVPFTSSPR